MRETDLMFEAKMESSGSFLLDHPKPSGIPPVHLGGGGAF